jgi:hypothetical protein
MCPIFDMKGSNVLSDIIYIYKYHWSVLYLNQFIYDRLKWRNCPSSNRYRYYGCGVRILVTMHRHTKLFILTDWLMIDYLRFYVPLKNCSLIWRRHLCRWRAVKFRSMLDTQGLWAGRGLYRATHAVTQDLGFFFFIWKTNPISRLLQHTWWCGGSILTWILTVLS